MWLLTKMSSIYTCIDRHSIIDEKWRFANGLLTVVVVVVVAVVVVVVFVVVVVGGGGVVVVVVVVVVKEVVVIVAYLYMHIGGVDVGRAFRNGHLLR